MSVNQDLGYTKLHATEIKGRHVNALVQAWQRQGLAPGTVKNRMAASPLVGRESWTGLGAGP